MNTTPTPINRVHDVNAVQTASLVCHPGVFLIEQDYEIILLCDKPAMASIVVDGRTFTDPLLRDRLTTAFGTRTYTMYLMQIRIVTFRSGTLLLHIPHEEVSDYIDSNNLQAMLRGNDCSRKTDISESHKTRFHK